MEGLQESRSALRKTYIRAREALSPEARAEKSRLAAERIASLPEFQQAATVLLYRAVRGELSLDVLPFLPDSAGKRFAYPRCLPGNRMCAMIPAGWEKGPFGIPEPLVPGSVPVAPEEIGLVICPGAAFDPLGHRLGMGGGYYDRFLPECPRASVGMAAFEAQRAPSLPAGPWDVPMQWIVTESAVIRPRKVIRVVAAVIRKDGRIFCTQRGYGPWKDGWEFPGGKIEPGETPQEALAREIREELDTEIEVGEQLAQVEYDYPEFHLSMGCYFCAVRSGSLTLREHESARWLRREELDSVEWLPADRSVIRRLQETDPEGGCGCG